MKFANTFELDGISQSGRLLPGNKKLLKTSFSEFLHTNKHRRRLTKKFAAADTKITQCRQMPSVQDANVDRFYSEDLTTINSLGAFGDSAPDLLS
ncbi:MAG: hypothetical protein ACRCSF_12585 [Mycobacteriaceae bacterium]